MVLLLPLRGQEAPKAEFGRLVANTTIEFSTNDHTDLHCYFGRTPVQTAPDTAPR